MRSAFPSAARFRWYSRQSLSPLRPAARISFVLHSVSSVPSHLSSASLRHPHRHIQDPGDNGRNVPKEDVRDDQQTPHLISADQIPIGLLTNFSKNALRLQGPNKKVLTGKRTELARLTSEFVDSRSDYGFAPKSIQGDVSCC